MPPQAKLSRVVNPGVRAATRPVIRLGPGRGNGAFGDRRYPMEYQSWIAASMASRLG
jgi:hypothetical protein